MIEPEMRPLPRFTTFVVLLMLMSGTAALLAAPNPTEPIRGMIGVGTWATQAEFKDIHITSDGRTLFASDFSRGLAGWKTVHGQWEIHDGILRQTSDEENVRAFAGDPTWSDYTVTLKCRKLGGKEGFLICFGVLDDDTKSWWNIGGWGNTRHAIEAPGTPADPVPGTIETGRWYDVRIELQGNTIRAYLDGQLVQSAMQTPAQRDFGHPIIPDLMADPSVVELDGTFYCNATTDGMGEGLSSSGLPVMWKSKDFVNWSFKGSIFAGNFDAKYWAPSSLVRKGGRYYLFPTLDNRITAVVSDSPDGPFRTLDGKDITKTSAWRPFPIKVGNPIDAEVLLDDDGAAYMVWSQRGIGKLKADFSDFDGEQRLIQTKRDGYSEGPFLFKRNGVYYYLYTLDGYENYKYAYMMSRTSPMGPWEAPEQDIIAQTDAEKGIFGPGHGCVFHTAESSQWYFIHLEFGRGGTNRQIWAEEMHFNADGTIRPISLSRQGVGALRPDANAGQVNLAFRARGSASSTRPDFRVPAHADPRLNRIEAFEAANAIDGSYGSRWLAREDDTSAWYELDFHDVRDVKRTELFFVAPTGGHAYRMEYSLDGQTWSLFGGHGDVIVQSPHTDLKSVRARYLKLTILRGAPGLWEFRVF